MKTTTTKTVTNLGDYAAARAAASENACEVRAAKRDATEKARRDAVWALVETKGDWRARIHAFVSADVYRHQSLSIREITEVIAFFTATEATFETVSHEGLFCGYVVKADGYRMGPAGDH